MQCIKIALVGIVACLMGAVCLVSGCKERVYESRHHDPRYKEQQRQIMQERKEILKDHSLSGPEREKRIQKNMADARRIVQERIVKEQADRKAIREGHAKPIDPPRK